MKRISKNFLRICRGNPRKAVNVRVNITSSSIDIRTFISRVLIYFNITTQNIFIVQVNVIKAKLTCQTVLLILYHHVTPRSEFQDVRLFARVLQAGKPKILQAGKSKILQAGKCKILQAGKSKILQAGKPNVLQAEKSKALQAGKSRY